MALNVAALAGDILLASGAEIFRVEETINRIAHAYGIDSCDPFVLSSGFFLTADSNSDQNFAWVRHIPLSATRLDRAGGSGRHQTVCSDESDPVKAHQ